MLEVHRFINCLLKTIFQKHLFLAYSLKLNSLQLKYQRTKENKGTVKYL